MYKSILFLFFSSLFCYSFAQTDIDSKIFHPEDQKKHQFYLDEPIQSIESIEYMDDGTPIKFELSKDGETVYLLDYTREGSIKAVAKDKNGETKEILKSKCRIDPVLPS